MKLSQIREMSSQTERILKAKAAAMERH